MLSVESRMNRFWEKPREMSPSRADSLTDTDRDQHIAWAALPVIDGELPGYAGASFWRSKTSPEEAELAFTVADAWQRKGLATLLFSILWHEAWHLGVREFVGYCRPRNEAIISWWDDVGGEVVPGPQQVSLRLPLVSPEQFLERVPFEMPSSFRRIETAEWMRRWVEEMDGEAA
jgi:GNAT superfamily N-acetyltransferase